MEEEIWDLRGEPRDWFYADYQNAGEKPFMFAFISVVDIVKTLELKVGQFSITDYLCMEFFLLTLQLFSSILSQKVANSQWSKGISLTAQNSKGKLAISDR